MRINTFSKVKNLCRKKKYGEKILEGFELTWYNGMDLNGMQLILKEK